MPFTAEVQSPVSATRMFKAAILDWHNLGHRPTPKVFASGSIGEGDCGISSVRKLNFTSVMPFSFVKERLDFVDQAKFECQLTVHKGGHVGMIPLLVRSLQDRVHQQRGCICKLITQSSYILEPETKRPRLRSRRGSSLRLPRFYLLANPNA